MPKKLKINIFKLHMYNTNLRAYKYRVYSNLHLLAAAGKKYATNGAYFNILINGHSIDPKRKKKNAT